MGVREKVAIVTGAASGMGATHARGLVAGGAKVVLGDVEDDQGARLAADLGDSAAFVHLDVRRDADWARVIERAESTFGRLDVLVNNAGVFRPGAASTCTDADWDLITGINLTGTFKGIRAAAPAMHRTGGGSIINISSTAGLKGFPDGIAYGASKWGVRGLTKHAAIDLAPWHIRVNSIHPGNVATPMIDGLYQNFDHVLQGRPAQPEEITALVLFLAGEESSFSTGSEFIADGGETAGLPRVDEGPGE